MAQPQPCLPGGSATELASFLWDGLGCSYRTEHALKVKEGCLPAEKWLPGRAAGCARGTKTSKGNKNLGHVAPHQQSPQCAFPSSAVLAMNLI